MRPITSSTAWAATPSLVQRDRLSARNFGVVAAMSGVHRIVYLGGLGDPEADLSKHLRSRQETGEILRRCGVPVTEFRAGMVVGSGSFAFEMMRHLAERLPVMICPRWVFTRSQPIAIRDMLQYLTRALTVPQSAGRIIEVGGPDVVTYADMLHIYAHERGLRRLLIPVPVLTPGLSSHWVHWMTPVSIAIARPLILGLHNELLVDDRLARTLFPDIQPLGFRGAVDLALENMHLGEVETIWRDALASHTGELPPVLVTQEQGMLIERRQQRVDAPPAAVFRVFSALGGSHGWPAFNSLWELRGILDRMVGGVGMRRGRRHPDNLRVGDTLDFWRVEGVSRAVPSYCALR